MRYDEETYPRHPIKYSSRTHEVESYLHIPYVSCPEYPFNKPVVRCTVNDIQISALIDPGADISLISDAWVRSNIHHPHLYALDAHVLCYPYNKKPQKSGVLALHDKNVAVIREVLFAEIALAPFRFSFPIHCHPDDIPLMILGNDYSSLIEFNVNVANSMITIPKFKVFETAVDNQRVINEQGDDAAFEYLIANLAMLTAGKAAARSDGRMASYNNKGVELDYNEFLIYPNTSANIDASQCALLPCHTNGVPLRENCCYAIRAVTRGPLGDIQVLTTSWLQQDFDSEMITLPVTTETAAYFTPSYPCAVGKPVRETCIEALTVRVPQVMPSNHDPYPEFSLFVPIAFHPDLPMPTTPESRQLVRDYTDIEWAEVLSELPRWVVIDDDGKAFMTPRNNVRLPILSEPTEFGDYRRHAILAKMLSTLPENVWFQENPTELPGVPMNDMAVRVRVGPGPPKSAKMRRMAPDKFKIV